MLASCYASYDHDLSHFAMTPMQWFPEIIQWAFGMNKAYPIYVNIAKEFGTWILQHVVTLWQKQLALIGIIHRRQNIQSTINYIMKFITILK